MLIGLSNLAISCSFDYLYFSPLTSDKIYSIKVDDLYPLSKEITINENYKGFASSSILMSGNGHLYLADLNIFNSDLDVSRFDLVLIDDCHLSSTNKYDPINKCKQVILFGDKSFKSSVSNTLLQRIGDAPINQYLNRYVKMSPKFNNVWNNNNRYI